MSKNIKIDYPQNFAYKFRIYPDKKQKELIELGFRLNRDVYNFLVSDDIKKNEEAVLAYLENKYKTTITVQNVKKYTHYFNNGVKIDLKLETGLKPFVKKYRTDNKTWFVAQSNPNKGIIGAYRKFLDYTLLEDKKLYFEYKSKVSSHIINGAIESFKNANDKFKKVLGSHNSKNSGIVNNPTTNRLNMRMYYFKKLQNLSIKYPF
jgi:hypothetical protein